MAKLWQQNKSASLDSGSVQNSLPSRDGTYQPKETPVSVRCPDVPFGSSIVPDGLVSRSSNLTPDNDTHLVDFSGSLDLETMQKTLAPYVQAAHQLSDVNEYTAPKLLSTLSKGLGQVLHYQATVKVKANMSAANRKNIEARVAINEFSHWAKETGGKQTDETRKLFIAQHALVLSAKKEEYEFDALYEFLSGVRQLFIMSLSSAKAIAYNNRDSYNVGGLNRVE